MLLAVVDNQGGGGQGVPHKVRANNALLQRSNHSRTFLEGEKA
jgi:hypothetical protein